MSEVKFSPDNISKNQWGKNNPFFEFLIEKEGEKNTLRIGRMVIIISIVFGFFVTLQLVYSPESSKTVGASQISMPSEVTESDIPAADIVSLATITRSKQAMAIKLSAPQLFERPKDLKRIPPGSLIKAKLVTGASNGLVRAESLEAVKVNGDTIIEKGSVYLGSGNSGEERLGVAFNQVIFKDGTFSQINAYACDESDRIVGLKGSRVGSRALNIAGGIGLGFLGGFSQGLQDKQGQQGAIVTEPSMKNALLNGTSFAALEQSKSIISELKDRPSILEVPQGTSICILFGESR